MNTEGFDTRTIIVVKWNGLETAFTCLYTSVLVLISNIVSGDSKFGLGRVLNRFSHLINRTIRRCNLRHTNKTRGMNKFLECCSL